MDCPCGRWDFRDVSLSTGLAVVERFCPRCRRPVLLCFRDGVLVAGVELVGGRHPARIESALEGSGFSRDEIELLVRVARLMDQVPRA